VRHVQKKPGVSERRACKVLGQPRSTHRYTSKKPEKDRSLATRIEELAGENPRSGYRQITALLHREGWQVNQKRVHRLWREGGHQVPRRQHKRRRMGTSSGGCMRLRPAYKNHVWSYDFIFDSLEDGRAIKFMPVLDEYTRVCHSIVVARSITSREVIQELERLFLLHGRPMHLRSDNGPEYTSQAVRSYLARSAVETRYIEPGAPWQNGYIESFNSTLRDELLDRELFSTVYEAEVLAEQFRQRLGTHRPHSSLGYQTPEAFARTSTNITHVNREPAQILR